MFAVNNRSVIYVYESTADCKLYSSTSPKTSNVTSTHSPYRFHATVQSHTSIFLASNHSHPDMSITSNQDLSTRPQNLSSTNMAPESLSAAMNDHSPYHKPSEPQLHPDLIDSGSLFSQTQDVDQSNDEWTTTAAAVAAVQAAQVEESRSNEANEATLDEQKIPPTPSVVDMTGNSACGSAAGSAPTSRPNSTVGSRPTSAIGSRGNTPPVLQPRIPNINEPEDAPPPAKKTRKRGSAGTKAQRALIGEEGMPAEYEDPTGDFRTGVIYVHAPPSTPQACMRCHAIKRKCDNRRPRCTGCEKADEPCAYEMNPATSR